jgi:hypothetical protein
MPDNVQIRIPLSTKIKLKRDVGVEIINAPLDGGDFDTTPTEDSADGGEF